MGRTQIRYVGLNRFKRRSSHVLNWRDLVRYVKRSSFELGLVSFSEDLVIFRWKIHLLKVCYTITLLQATVVLIQSFFIISNRYRRGRNIRITYNGKRRIIRRITRRFKVRIGYKRWTFIRRRRGRLVVRCRGRYRRFRIGRRIRVRYRKGWRIVWRKPRGRRGRRRWRRRRRRRRRRRIRRRRRRYRRRVRRRRRLNILRFKYGRKWISVYRRGRYLRCRIKRRWRLIRYVSKDGAGWFKRLLAVSRKPTKRIND